MTIDNNWFSRGKLLSDLDVMLGVHLEEDHVLVHLVLLLLVVLVLLNLVELLIFHLLVLCRQIGKLHIQKTMRNIS